MRENTIENNFFKDNYATECNSNVLQTLYLFWCCWSQRQICKTVLSSVLGKHNLDLWTRIMVSFQPQNKKSTCCIYLAALAVTDNLFLINCLELTVMMGFFPQYFKDSHCKFMAMHYQVRMYFLQYRALLILQIKLSLLICCRKKMPFTGEEINNWKSCKV